MTAVQLVWLKRDLRGWDHAALAAAALRGPLLPVYIAEPGLWAQPDAAGRHWALIVESLNELCAELAALGQPLLVRTGEVVPVLRELLDRLSATAVWSHEETGNGWDLRPRPLVAHLGAAHAGAAGAAPGAAAAGRRHGLDRAGRHPERP